MQDVFWDIIEPEPEEGLEERSRHEPDTELGLYFKKRLKRKGKK